MLSDEVVTKLLPEEGVTELLSDEGVTGFLTVPTRCLRNRAAQVSVGSATPKQAAGQAYMFISVSHTIWRPGQPGLALTLRCQTPGRGASIGPMCESQV